MADRLSNEVLHELVEAGGEDGTYVPALDAGLAPPTGARARGVNRAAASRAAHVTVAELAGALLADRAALRAADELAEALANERRVFDETPRTPSTSTAPIVRAIRRRERAEAAYRAARGER